MSSVTLPSTTRRYGVSMKPWGLMRPNVARTSALSARWQRSVASPLWLHRDLNAVALSRRVTDDIDYLTAIEENHTIAQAERKFNLETREFGTTDKDGNFVPATRVLCRTKDADGVFGEPGECCPKQVDCMDRFPASDDVGGYRRSFRWSDDANRALVGSNMQRQAVPAQAARAACRHRHGAPHRHDSGEILITRRTRRGRLRCGSPDHHRALNNDGG